MSVDIDTSTVSTILNEAPPLNTNNLVPKWLDGDFLEKHLQNFYGDKRITIVNFEVKPGTAKGENYASSLYRVKIAYSNETRACSGRRNSDFKLSVMNIIVKTAVSGEFALEVMTANNVYDKEMEFYSKITPKINQGLKKLKETDQLIAEPYGVCLSENAMLFEDLSLKGYNISSVHRGFNFDEAKLALKKAATFHAINAVLQEEDPNIFENFKYGLVSRHTDAFDIFYLTQLDMMMEVVSTWPDSDYYIEKMQRVRSNLMEKGAKTFDPDPTHFNTLIHGDMWINNLMMKHVEKFDSCDESGATIENMIFIDFQFSSWTSPTVDLHHFFNTSLQEPLRPGRFDDLIEFYHGILVDYLKRLGYKKPIPSLEEFKQQYIDKMFHAFITSCLIQPCQINEEIADADVEALITGDERSMKYKRIVYSSSKVRANLRKLIPMYDDMGLFD